MATLNQTHMKRLTHWSGAIAAVAVAGIIIWGLLASRSGAPGSTAGAIPDFYDVAGQTASAFTLHDLTNTPRSLSDFRGQRVLINFWYVACPGCRTEMPDMEQFYRQSQGQNIVVLGINIADDANTASQFMQQLGITYPVVLDRGQHVLDLYNVTSTPSSFFIDSQGILRGSVSGPLTLGQLQRYFSLLH